MSLTPEAEILIKHEEEVLEHVKDSLFRQAQKSSNDFAKHSHRARELTAELVAARGDSDKQLINYEETISHRLSKHKKHQVAVLDKLLSKPYFARVIVEEQRNGRPHEIEYKLGFFANPDCRIVDWRKAPIAKLYYEYKENEEYCEVIQGIERNGYVKLRNTVDIEQARLKSLVCRAGTFIFKDGAWRSVKRTSQGGKHSKLPDVLSIITPEQYKLITEDAKSCVIIQGVAGSGKTTVALYRLAWLLHGENSDIKAENCLIVLRSKILLNYVSDTLPEMGISTVETLTFNSWLRKSLGNVLSVELLETIEKKQYRQVLPSVLWIKKSPAIMSALEEHALSEEFNADTDSLQNFLVSLFEKTSLILKHDSSKLIDHEQIKHCKVTTKESFEQGLLDEADPVLLLRLLQIFQAKKNAENKSLLLKSNITVDEVQDYSYSELKVLSAATHSNSNVTLVGDSSQETNSHQSFVGWSKLASLFVHDEANASFTSLTVSHRSTFQIMRLANFISQTNQQASGRKGKAPLYIKCDSDNTGIEQVIAWLNRVSRRFPSSLIAVICRNEEEAKEAASFLEPSFGNLVHLGTEDDFDLSEGILVTSTELTKGLEFPNVLIWNPSERTYTSSWRDKNLLYIAITRAQEHLCLVTWDTPSSLLPHWQSNIVRGLRIALPPPHEKPTFPD